MKAPVAIEINDQFLKIVVAKSFVRQRQISDCIGRPIAGLDDKAISALISDTLRKIRIKPQPLIVSIPRSQVTVRSLHLPSKDKKEIDQMLQLHIVRMVPYKKEEILFGYSIAGSDDMDYTKLMLAIVHRDVLKRQFRIFEAADLLVDKMCLSTYGVWGRALSMEKQNINTSDLYLVLDVDCACTDFIIFNSDRLLFNHNINMDLNDGLNPDKITKLMGEIRQSLVIFHNEESNKNPARIFISGAPIAEELEKAIRPEFDIPMKVMPVSCPAAASGNAPKNTSFTALCEFVLKDSYRGISFMLPEAQLKKAFSDRARELMILGSLAIYFFAVSLLFFWGGLSNQQVYLNRLSGYSRFLEKSSGGILQDYKRLKIAKDFIRSRKSFLAIIGELQNITPQDIAIDSINMDEKENITLKGVGNHSSEVFNYIAAIETSKYFKNAADKYMRTKKLEGREITNFEIAFQFIMAEEPAQKVQKK